MLVKFFLTMLFSLIIFDFSHGAVSDTTKHRCSVYKKALHNMLESVNDLDRGSRFYTSESKILKIISLLDKTSSNLKKYETEARELDSYLKLRAYTVKAEGLEPLVEMRKKMKYGIGSTYRMKLSTYLNAFKSLLLFSKDNIKNIKKGNSQLRAIYDRYYLNYKKEYNQFKKVSKSLRTFIKKQYADNRILEELIYVPDRLFDESIWNLNRVKFFGK